METRNNALAEAYHETPEKHEQFGFSRAPNKFKKNAGSIFRAQK
jgi:hypothetical protein